MKKIVTIGLLASLMTTSLLADGAAAYKKCAGCHGANGEKVALGKSKVIKDMGKKELADALVGYQKGTYGGAMKSLMQGQVKGLSKADIDGIAGMIGK
jgi:cytochrome c